MGARVADVLRTAARRLAARGVPAPEREARLLWAAVSLSHPAQVWIAREKAATAFEAARFSELLERRAAGEPLAYVTGSAAFRHLDLVVDRRVLIPRPETEGLVEAVLTEARQRWAAGSWGNAADIGTGSGAIALSLALEGRFAHIVASDISPDALAVARLNIERVGPSVPVELRQGSLLEPLGAEQFRVIVANLPYVAESEWDEVDREVRDFEPHVALRGGVDGLQFARRLIERAGRSIAGRGLLALELDSRRVDAARAFARDCGWDARVEQDLFGRPRYLLAVRETK